MFILFCIFCRHGGAIKEVDAVAAELEASASQTHAPKVTKEEKEAKEKTATLKKHFSRIRFEVNDINRVAFASVRLPGIFHVSTCGVFFFLLITLIMPTLPLC